MDAVVVLLCGSGVPGNFLQCSSGDVLRILRHVNNSRIDFALFLSRVDRLIPTSSNDFFTAKVNEIRVAENQILWRLRLPEDDEGAAGSSRNTAVQKVLSGDVGVDTLHLFEAKKFRCIPIPYLYLVLYGIMHNFRTLV